MAYGHYAIYLMLVLATTLVIPFNTLHAFAFTPIVGDDSTTTNEGIPVTFDILGNDVYVSDPPTVTIVTPPSHGILSNPLLDPVSEQVTYTPNTNFYGTDTFQYKITENGVDSNIATVTIVVVQTQAQNMPPVAVPDSFTIPQGISSIQLNVLANDYDPENDPLTIVLVFGPQHGIVSISSDQKFVIYKPFNGYSGPDSFTYTISDGHDHGSSVPTATATSSVQVVKTNQLPIVTIMSPSNNSILLTHSVSINGTASNPSGLGIQQVTVSINGGTPIPATLSGSNWSLGTTLPDGQYNVVATATDYAGNTATASITITVDTTSPTITISSPSNGSTLTTITTPLSGTAVDNGSGIQQVTVSINGGTPIPATLSGSNWSISSVNLVLGSNIISATAKDNAGNTATTSATVTVNTLNPPVIITPFVTTNSPTQTITGTADPNVTINVYSGTTLVGTTTSDANGNWSLQVTLAQGPNTYTATETKSGITSGLSNSVTLTLNTTLPSISITSPSNGAMLNNHSVSINGTASNPSGLGIQQVTVSINGGTPIPATLSGSNWSLGTTLPDGQYNVVATAKDNAGNTATTSITITVDTTSPTITISSPSNGATIFSPVTITGTAADGGSGIKQIDISIDSGSFSTATGTTSWSLGTILTPGTHTITARVTDNAGNTATTSITIIIPLKPSIQQMNGYVIFGTKDVHIEHNTIVTSGSVGLQNKGQIHIEENSSLSSSSVVGDTIHIEKNSIAAASYYNTLQIAKGATAGTTTTPLTLPVVSSMPDFPSSFVVGTTNINVKSGSQIITPGNYNNISANKNAVLEFTGGTYNINSLSVQDGVTLKFDGPSLIFVKGSIDAGQGIVLNPSIDADKVLFYAGSHIHVGQSSTVNANMYALKDEIHLDQNSRDTGAFIAQSVHVEEGSIINFDYGFPPASGIPVSDIMIETHGKGSIGSNVNFNFSVKPYKNNILQGQLQYSDKSTANINLQSLSILTLTLNPNGSATFTGAASVNSASGYTFSVTVQDVADNSPNPDVFQIQIFKGTSKIYSNPGPVTQGDVEVETFNHNDSGQKD